MKTLTDHGAAVNAVAFSPDGKLLATGGEGSAVRLYSVSTWKAWRTLKGHEVAVRALAFSPNGAMLAAGTGNNTIALWDPQTGELKRMLRKAMNVPLRKP